MIGVLVHTNVFKREVSYGPRQRICPQGDHIVINSERTVVVGGGQGGGRLGSGLFVYFPTFVPELK